MRALLLLPLLAACAAAPDGPGLFDDGVRPRSAILYRDTVTVAMSDGSLCAGVREGRAGPWSTVLAGCPHRWPVSVLRPAVVPRLPLMPAASDPWVTLSPPGTPPLGFAPAAAPAGGA